MSNKQKLAIFIIGFFTPSFDRRGLQRYRRGVNLSRKCVCPQLLQGKLAFTWLVILDHERFQSTWFHCTNLACFFLEVSKSLAASLLLLLFSKRWIEQSPLPNKIFSTHRNIEKRIFYWKIHNQTQFWSYMYLITTYLLKYKLKFP